MPDNQRQFGIHQSWRRIVRKFLRSVVNDCSRKTIDTSASTSTIQLLIRIFTGKSIIRRLFWLVIVLGATAGCLNNVIDRIIYLAGQPTSTTVSITRQPRLTVPAVTECNRNQFRRDYVNPLAAIDAKMRHLHPPQEQALSRAH